MVSDNVYSKQPYHHEDRVFHHHDERTSIFKWQTPGYLKEHLKDVLLFDA